MPGLVDSWLLDVTGGRVAEFFAELGVRLPDNGTDQAQVRCFANPDAHQHGDRNKSCSINLLTGLWLCHACLAKGNAYQAAMALGRSSDDALEMARRFRLSSYTERPKLPTEALIKKWCEALRASEKLQDRLYELKGWSREAIRRLGLGWDGERIVFPLRVPKPKSSGFSVVGVARYLPTDKPPKMLSLPGSKRELFPMPELIPPQWPLFIVEGEPDAVSMWSLGVRAVGVPGAQSWQSRWVPRLAGRKLIVITDCDPPGRDLGRTIKAAIPSARIVDLDPIRDDGYDVGDLVREASHDPDPAALLWLGRIFEGLAST